MPASRGGDLKLYRRLLAEARAYWPHIAAIFALSLLSTPLALLTPVPLKLAVDNVIGDEPLPRLAADWLPDAAQLPSGLLAATAGLVVLIAFLVYLQSLAQWLLSTYTGERLVLALRARLFRHVQRLSLSYHDTHGSADATYRIQYDTGCIREVALQSLIPLATSSLMLVVMLWVIARIDWQLALIAVFVAPFLFLMIKASRRRLRENWSRVKQQESRAMSIVQEVLSALRVVKAFGREDHEQDRFERESTKLLRGQMNVATLEGGFDMLVGVTTAAGSAATLFIGIRHVQAGLLTLGDLLLVMAYLARLYQPLASLSRNVTTLQGALASAERTFALLDQTPDVPEAPHARPLKRAVGNVRFENVCFSYEPQRQVIDSVSFDIPAGTGVGIVGRTGAGKSTLMNLLLRFYDPAEGRVLLDGVDLREYRLADLRSQFSMVLQEPVLFSTTIGENIAYARPRASQEDVVAAAQAAKIHDFIAGLPEGYDTQVGERGMALSGGERQRVSLARAFLKDAPILILDEPTSSVDVGTETAIVEAMERLMEGRTTLMIAHRPSTVERCDLILRLEGGRLVDDGQALHIGVAQLG